METVLVVEDIDIMREDLLSMVDWESLGCRIVGEARNGRQGLDLYRKHRPSIVITDIRMPVMSGLEMIEEILRIHPGAQFILLTMYSEFAYAKSAMQLGVNSYILKEEINEKLLQGEIERVRGKLQEQRQADFWTGGHELASYLYAHDDDPPVPEVLLQAGRTAFFLVTPQSLAGTFVERIDLPAWLRLCGDRFSDLQLKGFLLSDRELLVLQDLSDQASTADAQLRMRVCAQAIDSAFQGEWGMAVAVAGGVVMERAEQFRACYLRIRQLLDSRFFWRGNVLLAWEERVQRFSDVETAVEPLLEQIGAALGSRDYDCARECLRRLFREALPRLGGQSFPEQVQAVLHLLEAGRAHSEQMQQLPVFRAELVLEHCIARVDEMEQGDAQGIRPKVRGILQYIQEHYHQNIGLGDLSANFALSEMYISQLFKKEVGCTFIQYLTQYRIKKAEELLATGRYKTYEVAEMVGYQTVPYFSKLFKKVTGRNPSDYIG